MVDLECCVSFRLEQSDSVICTHIYVCVYIHVYMCICISILFQILFPYRLLRNIECGFLSCIAGPFWCSILYIVVCICQSQTPNLPLPPLIIVTL